MASVASKEFLSECFDNGRDGQDEYLFVNITKNESDAKEFCAGLSPSATLGRASNANENDFLMDFIINKTIDFSVVSGLFKIYLGLQSAANNVDDKANTTRFLFVDGHNDPIDRQLVDVNGAGKFPWATGQPNDLAKGDDCVDLQLNVESSGGIADVSVLGWTDIPCSELKEFICRRSCTQLETGNAGNQVNDKFDETTKVLIFGVSAGMLLLFLVFAVIMLIRETIKCRAVKEEYDIMITKLQFRNVKGYNNPEPGMEFQMQKNMQKNVQKPIKPVTLDDLETASLPPPVPYDRGMKRRVLF